MKVLNGWPFYGQRGSGLPLAGALSATSLLDNMEQGSVGEGEPLIPNAQSQLEEPSYGTCPGKKTISVEEVKRLLRLIERAGISKLSAPSISKFFEAKVKLLAKVINQLEYDLSPLIDGLKKEAELVQQERENLSPITLTDKEIYKRIIFSLGVLELLREVSNELEDHLEEYGDLRADIQPYHSGVVTFNSACNAYFIESGLRRPGSAIVSFLIMTFGFMSDLYFYSRIQIPKQLKTNIDKICRKLELEYKKNHGQAAGLNEAASSERTDDTERSKNLELESDQKLQVGDSYLALCQVNSTCSTLVGSFNEVKESQQGVEVVANKKENSLRSKHSFFGRKRFPFNRNFSRIAGFKLLKRREARGMPSGI